MIYFNGIALENVAPVKIEDIRVSPISLNVTARQRPIRFGADFVRIGGGSRSVEVTFAVLERSRPDRLNYLQMITDWARTDTEGELVIPDKSGVFLNCICTGLPDPSMRQWWESKLRLTFTTYNNPFWTSVTEQRVACGTAFYVGGSAPPLIYIRRQRASSVSNVSYSDGTNTMTFSTIPAGVMRIDLNRQTCTIGSSNLTSFMQYLAQDSKFIPAKTGAQTITSSEGSGVGYVYWRERWQ